MIKSILAFFVTDEPPFPKEETLAVIAVRDAVIKAKALPFGSTVKVEK